MKRVAIHSVPRSGSSWLGEIFNSARCVNYCFQPLFSYAFKNFLTLESDAQRLDHFFEQLRVTQDSFVRQIDSREKGLLPNFKAASDCSHVVYKEVRYHHLIEHLASVDPNLKFVLLVRNPVYVMNSWVTAPKEFNPSWDIKTELWQAEKKNSGQPENFYGLQSWIETTGLFERLAEARPSQFCLVNYSALCSDAPAITERLFSHCELTMGEETLRFVKSSQSKRHSDAYSVFRGDERRALVLPDEIIEIINHEVAAAGLSQYLEGQSSIPGADRV